MSSYDDSDAEDVIDSFGGSFACLSKIKSCTPRARFDVHFYPTSIQLIQFSVQKQVSHRYRIQKGNVGEMLRLPYSNGSQIFFVLHLKRPIVGGNKSGTEYDFIVFNFPREDYEEVSLDFGNPIVKDMFDEDTIEGQTIDVFETILVKIFDKDVVTPAKDYEKGNCALALSCTFWDNDENFLYPLDDGFVNVFKYCQKLHLEEVKDVRFVRSQGRFKTFDFYIYPKMERAIRRYNIGLGKSNIVDCFFLEFKAIDLVHYDGLFAYCDKHEITISTNDFQQSASDTDGNNDDSESQSDCPTITNASETSTSESDEQFLDDGYEAPDPHMVQCQIEGRESESGNDSSDEENETATATSEDKTTSQETVPPKTQQRRRKKRSINIITDENDSSSSDSSASSPKKRTLQIDSDDDVQIKTVKKRQSLIIKDSESD